MHVIIKVIKCICSLIIFTYSQPSLGLLDIDGKGTAEDRQGLVLLYTFDDRNTQNKVLNQVNNNNPSHPTHLVFSGKRSNATISNGAINFNKNSTIIPGDQVYVRALIGTEVRGRKVTIQGKRDIASKILGESVYLKSQGDMNFNSLCPSGEEMTLQTFFKSKKVNYSPSRSHLLTLRPLASKTSSFSLSELYNQNSLYGNVTSYAIRNRDQDQDYNVINESVFTYKNGESLSSYHLLHGPSGKEGWLSNEKVNKKKLSGLVNSRLIVGTGGFPNGEGASNLLKQLNNSNDDKFVKPTIQNNTTGYTGTIYQIALYCRAVDQAEVLGGEYIDTTKIKVTPKLNTATTQSERVAVRLLSLITKKKIPIDAAIVKEAAHHISRGNYKKAALIGVELPDFYNNTVKELGLKMSNREETVDVPLNDMAATLVGIVRDQANAKELLTGNYFYRANPLVGVPSDPYKHMHTTNIHYEDIDKKGIDLSKALLKVSPQKILGTASSLVNHPDPAGVLTSRAFLSAHAVAGTNRRQVEYAFKQFMCVNLNDMADTEASDLRVGRDIDRFPANSHKKYQTSCKGCHSVMDGFRGAFSKTDFDVEGNYVRYADYFTMNSKRVAGKTHRYPANISYKVNHNEFSYPNGFVTSDDSFYNFANKGSNKILFGWRSPVKKGYGMGQFGKILSESERFSKCMVKRVFESVCPVKINESALAKLQMYVWDFESTNYNLKNLYMNAAISPLCLGSN